MPISIPIYDAEADELRDVEIFDCAEVGRMLHMHANTVRRYVREGRWPCIRVGHVSYMSKAMIGEAVETMTQRVGAIPEAPVQLGPVLPDEATESIR